MGFKVRPGRVKQFAREFIMLEAACQGAVTYAAHTKPDASGGSAFVRLLNSTSEVRPAVQELFAHLAQVCDKSADELLATARHYEDTDTERAAEADAQLHSMASTRIPKVG
ncbi:hypothetical protein [Nocardioides houyundeii]|uniref:hypothetical protein n=1 Tax=Nocardioides houyundeii TaxID=2045452 RepID=UPI000C78C272|nr:hypothetical protein [Nocardioides houyundeii]